MEPNRRNSNYYIDGNTVRKLETAPRRRRKTKERIDRPPETERQRQKQKQINQKIAKRNIEKATKLSLGYTLFLGVAVVVVFLTCVYYLNLNNMVTQRSNEITLLKKELNTITDANVAAAERINNAIDLETILTQARELGMDYPDAGQIIYFNPTDKRDYVRQYRGIPK